MKLFTDLASRSKSLASTVAYSSLALILASMMTVEKHKRIVFAMIFGFVVGYAVGYRSNMKIVENSVVAMTECNRISYRAAVYSSEFAKISKNAVEACRQNVNELKMAKVLLGVGGEK